MSKPIASLGLTNSSALGVWDVNDEYIIVSLNEGTKRKYKIYSTTKGFYFNYGGSRYYLHNFLRIEY